MRERKRMGKIQTFTERQTKRSIRALELLIEAEYNMISRKSSAGNRDQTSVESVVLELVVRKLRD